MWLSLARAPGLGPGGRRFESCHPDSYKYARVAQLVERDLAKVEAAGSSPVSRSLLIKRASDGCPFLLNRVLPDQVVRGLRSAPVGAEQTSTGRLAPSRALLLKALAISG